MKATNTGLQPKHIVRLLKLSKNFEEFTKKINEIEVGVPEIFAKVAKKSGLKFVNEAKDLTDENKLVDTGNYKRNWHTDIAVAKRYNNWEFTVKCQNTAEYAEFLEFGHKIKGTNKKTKGYFVGKQAMRKAEEYAVEQLKEELGSLFKE